VYQRARAGAKQPLRGQLQRHVRRATFSRIAAVSVSVLLFYSTGNRDFAIRMIFPTWDILFQLYEV